MPVGALVPSLRHRGVSALAVWVLLRRDVGRGLVQLEVDRNRLRGPASNQLHRLAVGDLRGVRRGTAAAVRDVAVDVEVVVVVPGPAEEAVPLVPARRNERR